MLPRLAAAAFASLAFTGLHPAPAAAPAGLAHELRATDRQVRTLPLPPERRLLVDITIGEVRVEGEQRPDARLEITRNAPTEDDLARIPLELIEGEAEVRLKVVQPDHETDARLRSDLHLRVPQTAVVEMRVVEGRVSLNALERQVTADIRRGPIEATDLQGAIRLETGIGDINARGLRLTPGGLIRLRTFNGDARLTLAERPANARILALALNGSVRSEIPLRMKEGWGPRFGDATLGTGEPVISIDVVTGDVDLRVQ